MPACRSLWLFGFNFVQTWWPDLHQHVQFSIIYGELLLTAVELTLF